MSINFSVERDIATEMLRLLPVMASRDGQVVVRSGRGMLVITSNQANSTTASNGNNSNMTISYSYVPTGESDIPISQSGSINDETDRIAELSYYLLNTYGGKIARTPEGAIDQGRNGNSNTRNNRGSGNFTGMSLNNQRNTRANGNANNNFGGNLGGFPYPDVNRREQTLGNINRMDKDVNAGGGIVGAEGLGDMGGGRGTNPNTIGRNGATVQNGNNGNGPLAPSPMGGNFANATPNGYGEYDMTGIRTTRMDESQMFNQGRGYDLSGGNTGDLLTSGTYDGGNKILMGGSNAYRSNYGTNRQPGTEYGEHLDTSYNEYEDTLNGNNIQDVTDTTETWINRDIDTFANDNFMYGGNDDDVDYLGAGNFLNNEERTGFIDNTADINSRMQAMNNPARDTTGTNTFRRGAGVNMTNVRQQNVRGGMNNINRMDTWNATVGSVNAMRGAPNGYGQDVGRSMGNNIGGGNANASFMTNATGIDPVNISMNMNTRVTNNSINGGNNGTRGINQNSVIGNSGILGVGTDFTGAGRDSIDRDMRTGNEGGMTDAFLGDAGGQGTFGTNPNTNILGMNNAGLTDIGTSPNNLGVQTGLGGNGSRNANTAPGMGGDAGGRGGFGGGVTDTYNNASTDLGIGYGDITAQGMGTTGGNNNTTMTGTGGMGTGSQNVRNAGIGANANIGGNAQRGSWGGNNVSRNATVGATNAQRGLGMGLGGNGQGQLSNAGVGQAGSGDF